MPEWTLNLAATWYFAWLDGIGGYMRGDAQYVDSRITLFDPTLPEFFPTLAELDSYSLFNLRLGAEQGPWRVELFVDNLFDEKADLFCCRYDFDTAINRPRTTGARLLYDFY